MHFKNIFSKCISIYLTVFHIYVNILPSCMEKHWDFLKIIWNGFYMRIKIGHTYMWPTYIHLASTHIHWQNIHNANSRLPWEPTVHAPLSSITCTSCVCHLEWCNACREEHTACELLSPLSRRYPLVIPNSCMQKYIRELITVVLDKQH